MKNIIAQASRFVRDEDGISAIEYALLGSLIAIVIGTAMTSLATAIKTTFDNIATAL
ncbi:pilus assembly protein Flp/PilA [Paraburkholderia fungorum]|uniref:Pilus assembly protein Flp/PilA n=1 Tax=Paraburkholderia fungorum TaxID=134537 RepID=A0A1H1IVF1_9BURK|nr:Flp family type IVb pilin [Paraburkholderia fungorum]SDR41550.1 pilus assembly protein Flp/PilA [Paraburkholderia fungorum]